MRRLRRGRYRLHHHLQPAGDRHGLPDRAARRSRCRSAPSTAVRSSMPQMKPVEQHLIPAAAAQRSLDLLNEFGVDIWLFTNDQWLTRNPDGEYVPHEKRAIKHDPVIVPDFAPYVADACKIVGASSDAALLQRCEAAMQEAVGTTGHRGTLAELLSRRHAARPRQGHLRRGDGAAARAFRPTRSRPSATCRTIWRCSPKAACRLRWATPPTTSRNTRRM